MTTVSHMIAAAT